MDFLDAVGSVKSIIIDFCEGIAVKGNLGSERAFIFVLQWDVFNNAFNLPV